MNRNHHSAVHIYLSTFENESRILKQTKSLIDHNIVDRITVISFGRESLEGFERIDKNRGVYRIRPNLLREYLYRKQVPHGYGLYTLISFIRFFEFVIKLIKIIKNEKPDFVNLHQILLLPLIPFIKIVSFKSKLIYDTHELETETNGLKGYRKKLFKFIEWFFIRWFNYVFVVSPSIEDWYRKTYGIQNIATVMNCPNLINIKKKNLFREQFLISDSTKIFLYQGALFKGRGIEILLETFKALPSDDYCLILMGYGKLENLIIEYSEKYKNIHFKPAVSPDVVLEYTSSADYGISLIENICLSYYYCLPNKLFEYLMVEIPVIVSDMKEMKNFVEKTGAGLITKENSADSLTDTILALKFFDQELYNQSISAIKNEYCWEKQETIMIEAYQNILK
tara:strand:+ start:13024 stop:14211 length:1188 start_codon:yes stop_codon:yes gene_type:complete